MYLGLDLGTTDLKLLLVDDGERPVAMATRPLSVARPRPLWSEQDPEAWWRAVESALDEIARDHGPALAAVRGIGLAGQMHGAVLLDRADHVLRPAILWNDGRSAAGCGELERRVPDSRAITGNLAMPGFTAPKLLWVARHEPELIPRLATVLLPKDYLRLRLTGERVSEMSDAAGTLWLDVGRRDWSDTMLAATGLTRRHMPRLVEGTAVSGRLRPALAARWGLGRDVVVAGGAGDNAAAGVGMGAIAGGQGFVSLGTSGVVFAAADGYGPDPDRAVHSFCHAVPGRWHQMSVILAAGASLAWAARLFGIEAGRLASEAAQADAAAAPLFLPYLSGERTPHNDATAQGVLFGLTADHDRAAVAYAVLEGVAFALADGLAALDACGSRPQRLMLVGGGARSRLWAELIASAFGQPLDLPGDADRGAAFGAARLARLAASGAPPEAVCRPPDMRDRIEPDPRRQALLAGRQARFRRLYPMLRTEFAAVAAAAGAQ